MKALLLAASLLASCTRVHATCPNEPTAVDRVLEVAFNHRRRADVQYAKRYLDEVGIGRVYHARASWKRRSGIPGLRSWFTNKAMAGGAALIDLGPHVLDSLLFLLGEPRVVAVSAVTRERIEATLRRRYPTEKVAVRRLPT